MQIVLYIIYSLLLVNSEFIQQVMVSEFVKLLMKQFFLKNFQHIFGGIMMFCEIWVSLLHFMLELGLILCGYGFQRVYVLSFTHLLAYLDVRNCLHWYFLVMIMATWHVLHRFGCHICSDYFLYLIYINFHRLSYRTYLDKYFVFPRNIYIYIYIHTHTEHWIAMYFFVTN